MGQVDQSDKIISALLKKQDAGLLTLVSSKLNRLLLQAVLVKGDRETFEVRWALDGTLGAFVSQFPPDHDQYPHLWRWEARGPRNVKGREGHPDVDSGISASNFEAWRMADAAAAEMGWVLLNVRFEPMNRGGSDQEP